jgi:hypothetical protein
VVVASFIALYGTRTRVATVVMAVRSGPRLPPPHPPGPSGPMMDQADEDDFQRQQADTDRENRHRN